MTGLHRVEMETRIAGRLDKLARRSQARFWALSQDLRRQGPEPRGWPGLTRFDEDCFYCQLDQRLLCGWLVRPEGTLELLAPRLSANKLPFARDREFEELLLRLLDPPVEVRFQGAGAHRFLTHLRETYPGLVTEPQVVRRLVECTTLGWHAQWAEFMTPGKCLTLYRQNAGFSLVRLARGSGLSRRELQEMEDDRLPLSDERARTLAIYLQCDHRSLLALP